MPCKPTFALERARRRDPARPLSPAARPTAPRPAFAARTSCSCSSRATARSRSRVSRSRRASTPWSTREPEQLAARRLRPEAGGSPPRPFGGGSWLAHATMQSGAWVNSQGRYGISSRGTASRSRRRSASAGWRTVADVPSDTETGRKARRSTATTRSTTAGTSGIAARSTDSPRCRTSTCCSPCSGSSCAKAHRRPVFAEVDLVSSHTPWILIPPLIDWNRVGDGSVFNRLPNDESGFTDAARGYSRSIKYSLRALFSFVQHYGNKNLVMIVLGDPSPRESSVTAPATRCRSRSSPTTRR